MNMFLNTLLTKYGRIGILPDANLLVLYYVGLFDEEQVPKFKRTKKFTVEDHFTLVNLLGYFEKIVTTPNILTEVSNLLGQLQDHLKFACFEVLGRGITLLEEHYIPSGDIVEAAEFKRFGLTDAGILRLATNNYLVLTVDFPLSQSLQKKGIDVLNFNHIRPSFWK